MKAINNLPVILLFLLSRQISIAQPAGFYDARVQAHITAPIQKTASALVVAEWQLDSMHCESFNGQGWDADSRSYYRYDAQHRRVQDSLISFDHAQQIWQPSMLTFYEYLSGDDVKTIFDLSWNGQAWGQDTMRTRNVYANGQLTEIYEETYAGQGWVSNGKTTMTYDNQGHVSQRFSYFLDETTNEWTVIGRSTPTYLGDFIKEEVFEFTNDNGITWQSFSRVYYTIENGRIEGVAIQIWNGADWGPFFREEYTFDDRGLVVHEDSYQFNNGWEPTERCDLFYSEQTTAVHNPVSGSAASLQMANPFAGGMVSAPRLPASQDYRISVFDLNGRPVYDAVASGNQWQLSAPQTAGTYMLTVRTGDQVVARRKFVVAR